MLPVSAVGLRAGWLQVFLRVGAEFGCTVRTAEIIGLSAVLDFGGRRLGVNLHAADWITNCCGALHRVSRLLYGRVVFTPVFLGDFAMRHGVGADQVHFALGAFAGLVGDDVGMGSHGAGVEHGGLRAGS